MECLIEKRFPGKKAFITENSECLRTGNPSAAGRLGVRVVTANGRRILTARGGRIAVLAQPSRVHEDPHMQAMFQVV